MFTKTFTTFLAATASLVSAASIPIRDNGRAGTAAMTPHDLYSSSIGVLGCKINTNRVAYWPTAVGCDDLCVKVTNGDRYVHLLRIDQSGGAHDISYDAWNYLMVGKGAAENPTQGGGVSMDYETVPMSECGFLLEGTKGKIPLTAANSMNYLASCLAQPDSYVAKNHALYNIANSVCTFGADELCSLDLAVSNQPSCPSMLGIKTPLKGLAVENIIYPSGTKAYAIQ
ncbi:hypothetical protein C8034_v000651 [Colletotrichum sidae]|uniref:Cerato-platanin n=4 Tax=Colletotrichum orbiculare species complex TaxID=2707354 RepID=N4VH24_COLOR|nr:hypothetical protein Cob_v010976 [Colletotrichum orbiculare MAFF 240422]TDZ35574.1 hypothetical protein C8035_v009745 [Colletotrichum spinosum]TDZ49576.1 hypothetical protein CTRI78_v008068 [Colletotrichum trifolii]TEA16969.1 hypothetical protein C8034_v000651 [Colletotrichum sidae]